MQTFDLFLVSEEGVQADGEAVRNWLAETPHLKAVVGDPTRFAYYNPDTTVHFSVLVDPDLILAETTDEEDDEPGSPRHHSILPEAEDFEDAEEDEYDDDDDDDDGEDEEEAEDSSLAHLPPLAVNVPLFRPTFFVEEALWCLDRLRTSEGLFLVDAHAEGEEAHTWDFDGILQNWQLAHRRVTPELKNPDRLTLWSAEKCQAFYSYTSQRREIAEQFSSEELEVAQLHPAAHDGRVKTLCIWRTDVPTILPRSDLVLLQRPRERRGLLGRTKTVLDEGLVPSEEIWKILGPFVEVRQDPAPFLIFRQATQPPAQVPMALDSLSLETVANARRTELAGVIDFDLTESTREETG